MDRSMLEFTAHQEYLEVRYFGPLDENTLVGLVDVIKQELIKIAQHKILIDMTGAIGEIATPTRFKIGFSLAASFGAEFRLGVLDDKERTNMIGKNVAAARGVNIFLGFEKSLVIKWLLQN